MLLRDRLVIKEVIRATEGFNLHRNNVARQVEEKCCPYYGTFKRLRRLSGNFILLKASLFNKGLPFRARPSQSGLPSVFPAMWGGDLI